jgi:hypothetical protein
MNIVGYYIDFDLLHILIIIGIIIWVILTFVLALTASYKGRSYNLFFVLGVFLSPLIGFIILFALGKTKAELELEKITSKNTIKCPFCDHEIENNVDFCKYCGKNKEEISKKIFEDIKKSEFAFMFFPEEKKDKKSLENPYIVIIETPLKNAPDLNANNLVTLRKDEIINFVSNAYDDTITKNIWYKVKYKQYEGWCLYKNIKKYDG